MKLIVGLGNPGKEYAYTRHNIGFLVIDEIASTLQKEHNVANSFKYKAEINEVKFNNNTVLLVKPLTYMNLSGDSIKLIIDNYKIELDDILVIYDDLDLPTGKVRYREKGSAGGHRGILSTIQRLDTDIFKRVKIGIDRPQNSTVIDYVLTEFSDEERVKISESIVKVSDGIINWLEGTDYKEIMKNYN